MVRRPSAVGEAPSPDGRVLSDLGSSCLAHGVVVALHVVSLIGQSDTRTIHLVKSEWSLHCSSVFRRCISLFVQ